LTPIDFAVPIEEEAVLTDVKTFLDENRKTTIEGVEIQEKYNKKYIVFLDKPSAIYCTVIIDPTCVFKEMGAKIKTVLSFQKNFKRALYDIQAEMEVYSLLKGTGMNNYLVVLMLIIASQMIVGDQKVYVKALSDEFAHVEKISKKDLIFRFCHIFSAWVQNGEKKLTYFSPLQGKIVEGLKPEFEGDNSLIYIEDPFTPNYNSFKTVDNTKEFKQNFAICLEALLAKADAGAI